MYWARIIVGAETVAAITKRKTQRGRAGTDVFIDFSESHLNQQRFCNTLRLGIFMWRYACPQVGSFIPFTSDGVASGFPIGFVTYGTNDIPADSSRPDASSEPRGTSRLVLRHHDVRDGLADARDGDRLFSLAEAFENLQASSRKISPR